MSLHFKDLEVGASPPVSKEDLGFILNKISDLIPGLDFRNEKILLTGGTGFFGKWLTQALLAMNDQWGLGNELTLVTRDQKRAITSMPWLQHREDVHFIESDIRNLQSSQFFTTIIHGAAAASQSLNESRPDEMFETILKGTNQILRLAANDRCRRVQFISSGAVYGTQPPDLSFVSEDYLGAPDPLDFRSAYGEGKRGAEFLAAEASRRYGFQLSIPRCFAFIGPYLPLDTHFAAGNFVKSVLDNECIHIAGDGTPFRSYLYAADLVVWLIVHLLKKSKFQAMNVGSDQPVSILDLAKAAHRAGIEVFPERRNIQEPIKVAREPSPDARPARYVPATERARKSFALEPWTSLPDALSKTLDWHRKYGDYAKRST